MKKRSALQIISDRLKKILLDDIGIKSVILLLSLFLAGVARLMHPVFSIYEIILIFYEICSVLLVMISIQRKKSELSTMYVLRFSCFMMLGVVLYSTMTYGQANIHGDTAIATLLARSEIKHHSIIPLTWCYANGDVWLLDTQLAVLPFTLLMKNQVTARMLGTILMMLLGIIGLYLLDKYLLRFSTHIISIPVIFGFIFGGDSDIIWGNDHINYQASYTCWLIFIPLMCILVFKLFIQGRLNIWWYVLFFCFSVVTYARGIRAIAELMLPLGMAYFFFVFISEGTGAMKKWYQYLFFVVPALIGCFFYKNICDSHIVNTSVTSGTAFVSDLEKASENAYIVFLNLFKVFGYNAGANLVSIDGLANMISIISCVLFVFILPILQIIAYKNESDGVRFFVLFSVIHNTEMVISTIFFDKTSASHIFTFVLVSIMLSSVYVMHYWIGDKKHAFIYGVIFASASLVMTLQLGIHSRGWQGKVAEKRMMAKEMMMHGLDDCKGYGTFWNIYPLSIYSDLKLDVAAIGNSDIAVALTPHLNLVDTDKYIPDRRGSYIMLDFNENEELGSGLENTFGECKEKFTIGENYIYVWDYDVCVDDFSGRKRAE